MSHHTKVHLYFQKATISTRKAIYSGKGRVGSVRRADEESLNHSLLLWITRKTARLPFKYPPPTSRIRVIPAQKLPPCPLPRYHTVFVTCLPLSFTYFGGSGEASWLAYLPADRGQWWTLAARRALHPCIWQRRAVGKSAPRTSSRIKLHPPFETTRGRCSD